MSRRDDRDRGDRDRRGPSQRKNEYFLPKSGIDREVITADICRYLGQDALVRPYKRENPQTRQMEEGYLISAYRNLTTAMISDLIADSKRWEAERINATRGQNPYAHEQHPPYSESQTFQHRKDYPSSAPQGTATSYPTSTTPSTVYDDGRGQQYAQGSQQGYGQQQHQDYPMQQDTGSYVYGGDWKNEGAGRGRAPVAQPAQGTFQREQYASGTPAYPQSSDPRYGGYAQPVAPTSQYPQQQQPTDPIYGRGTQYESSGYAYDYSDNTRGYSDQTQYTQPMVSAPSTTVTSEPAPPRRPHGREDRNSKHSHRDNRR